MRRLPATTPMGHLILRPHVMTGTPVRTIRVLQVPAPRVRSVAPEGSPVAAEYVNVRQTGTLLVAIRTSSLVVPSGLRVELLRSVTRVPLHVRRR